MLAANALAVTPRQFFASLSWLDGSPLLGHIEPYRMAIFDAFNARGDDGHPRYNLGLFGRAKKNFKTFDLVLWCAFCLLADSPGGNQVYLIANDADQAHDDLTLLKKLIKANPRLGALLVVKQSIIERKDGGGFIEVLAAGDAIGSHGKTYRLLACDEIHGYRDWDLLEALAPDPTRRDCQQWITSYASLRHRQGVPLFDMTARGRAGSDPGMLFSWFSADYTTSDTMPPDATPEQRANPSMHSWRNPGYLEQQRRRLPSGKYRRLHLNLPGVPAGAAFDADAIANAIDRGVRVRPPLAGLDYAAFVDMSGGSSDDAVLAIGHQDAAGRAVLDSLTDQGTRPPFDPSAAVTRFVQTLRAYGCTRVTGDAYAGLTFKAQFDGQGITFDAALRTRSDFYEALEPIVNGGRVVLLDAGPLEAQLLGLVWRGPRIDHEAGGHDDFANAAAGVVSVLQPGARGDGGGVTELRGWN